MRWSSRFTKWYMGLIYVGIAGAAVLLVTAIVPAFRGPWPAGIGFGVFFLAMLARWGMRMANSASQRARVRTETVRMDSGDGTNPTEYWYNDHTREVEVGPQSLAIYRIGPFATREEAARAPEIVAERARKWAAEDSED